MLEFPKKKIIIKPNATNYQLPHIIHINFFNSQSLIYIFSWWLDVDLFKIMFSICFFFFFSSNSIVLYSTIIHHNQLKKFHCKYNFHPHSAKKRKEKKEVWIVFVLVNSSKLYSFHQSNAYLLSLPNVNFIFFSHKKYPDNQWNPQDQVTNQ